MTDQESFAGHEGAGVSEQIKQDTSSLISKFDVERAIFDAVGVPESFYKYYPGAKDAICNMKMMISEFLVKNKFYGSRVTVCTNRLPSSNIEFTLFIDSTNPKNPYLFTNGVNIVIPTVFVSYRDDSPVALACWHLVMMNWESVSRTISDDNMHIVFDKLIADVTTFTECLTRGVESESD